MSTLSYERDSLNLTSIHRPEEEQGFSRSLVEDLLEGLENSPLPHLTPNEHAHLLVLIQATLEVTSSIDLAQCQNLIS